jgi:hypothetical protein
MTDIWPLDNFIFLFINLPTFNIINNNNKNKNSYLLNGKMRSICGKSCEIVPVLPLLRKSDVRKK